MDSKCKKVRRALEEGLEPDDNWSDAMVRYHEYLKDGVCNSDDHKQAFLIFENDFEKEVIEALLLSDTPLDDIDTVFEIAPEIVRIYKELFFETDSFSSKLARISYVENYAISEFGRGLKLRALHLGGDYVLFRLGNYIPQTSSQQILVKRLFMSAAYRAMEANFNPLNSQATKNATQHAGIMLKAYDVMKELFKDDTGGQDTMAKIIMSTDNMKPMITNAPIEKKDII